MELNLLTAEYLGVLSVPCVSWLIFSSVGRVFHYGGNFLIVMGVILIVEVDPYISFPIVGVEFYTFWALHTTLWAYLLGLG